ncbi:MAG: 1-(5-phosphoribosyl)-5-[(5-phosphoribosylamino) methylideneamino]imidazole-4-carboxamide isomerase [Calditrichia bacterium]
MEIIPAIDIIAGKVVRLKQGNFSEQTVYSENPLQLARLYEAAGFRRLHLVDLDGARQKSVVNWETLRSIVDGTGLQVDFGGGIRTNKEAAEAFRLGAAQINVGSLAVKRPEMVADWLGLFGREKLILSADVLNGFIATHGWQQLSDIRLFDFLKKFIRIGIRWVALTDVSRDGMLSGPALDLYREVKNAFPQLKLIASGGVSRVSDLVRLKKAGLDGVIIGKALLTGNIKKEEVQPFLD